MGAIALGFVALAPPFVTPVELVRGGIRVGDCMDSGGMALFDLSDRKLWVTYLVVVQHQTSSNRYVYRTAAKQVGL
jgi:hypothetical protein